MPPTCHTIFCLNWCGSDCALISGIGSKILEMRSHLRFIGEKRKQRNCTGHFKFAPLSHTRHRGGLPLLPAPRPLSGASRGAWPWALPVPAGSGVWGAQPASCRAQIDCKGVRLASVLFKACQSCVKTKLFEDADH